MVENNKLSKTEMLTMISIVLPYILVLFFFRHTDLLRFLGLLIFNALFIVVALIILLLTQRTKFRKGYYVLAASISVTVFFVARSGLMNTADQIFFTIHKTKMVQVVDVIEKAKLQNKSIEMPELSFAKVDTLESGEVIFTIDGMLDNCVGIAYVKDNKNPGYTNCGRIIEWRKLDDRWYFWYTT